MSRSRRLDSCKELLAWACGYCTSAPLKIVMCSQRSAYRIIPLHTDSVSFPTKKNEPGGFEDSEASSSTPAEVGARGCLVGEAKMPLTMTSRFGTI